MLGAQPIFKILPKTGTSIMTVCKDGVKLLKVVTPGPGNSKSNEFINGLTTHYRNGKARYVVLDYQHTNASLKHDAFNYHIILEKAGDVFERIS